uniref:GST N-terminal domain-containing protein n=1 Tax=Chromera velia CCMP2878 TaxID=1169474 RepID=A0A0G4FF97_9ALVE|eukprot:Cvel_16686.t1-p1 / transcript=Cvel_16686.t1 / gene=Cvel_16686 / organism=Chromera_velia_CCMP2878 / gene_product=Probable glutathione transferase omega-2, putative / transcript_product=Probable glutathione transferase omega-2, putative / location=Cvel_scaffold1295:37331-39285(-) / protein_length=294 / sequence_SO=supercontig / SO=protein_coding / is_pseudo=false
MVPRQIYVFVFTVLMLNLVPVSCFSLSRLFLRPPSNSLSLLMMSTGSASAPYTLYVSETCPYAQRSLIAANLVKEKTGTEFDVKMVKLGEDNKQPWFLALNPLGKVPVLKDERSGVSIYESLVVNEFIADACDSDRTAGLTSASPMERANMRIRITRVDTLARAFFTFLSASPDLPEIESNALLEKIFEELVVFEHHLKESGGKFMGGSCPDLCDCALFPFIERMNAVLPGLRAVDFPGRLKAEFPFFSKWMDSMRELPAVKSTCLSPEVFVELYKKFLSIDYFKKVGMADKKG